MEDGTHLLCQVPPEDVLPAGDAQGGGHGLCIECGLQHQHSAVDTTVSQVVCILLRAEACGWVVSGTIRAKQGYGPNSKGLTHGGNWLESDGDLFPILRAVNTGLLSLTLAGP